MRATYTGSTSGVAIPKDRAYRSEKYRRLVASLPCIFCGVVGYSQAAHPNTGKGGAIKTDDRDCFPLCTDAGCDRGLWLVAEGCPDGGGRVIGQKYGRMTILAELPRRYSHRMVLCQCDCGTKKTARLTDLKRGQTVSCGCWKTNPRKKAQRAASDGPQR